MTTQATNPVKYGVWDTQFADWDSGPYSSVEAATRSTYVPALKESDDPTNHRASKHLVVKAWDGR